MKKILFAISALFVVLSLGAQSQKQSEQGKKFKEGVEEFRKEAMERLQSEHVAYLTNELQLTPEEAQAFWPVYNQAVKEQREAFAKVRDAKKALRDAINEGKSDAEVKPILDAYLKLRADKSDPMAEHRADFVKAVGESKTAKFYLSEDSFRNKALREMAGHGTSVGRGQGPRPSGK